MDKKKIVHVVESFGGGVFSFLVDLVNATIDDFDITIIYGVREQTPKEFEKYFDERVKFIKSEYLKREIKLKNEIKAIQEIKRSLKEIKPDVVHLHSSKAGAIGRIALDGKTTKVIYNPHGFSFLMNHVSKLKKTFYWTIEKILASKKAIIVGCSKGEYEEAKKLTKNAIHINNGINLAEIDKQKKQYIKKQLNFQDLSICTIGRIDYQKNPQLFNEIASNFPNIKFTWIGDGDLKEELKSSNITVTGWKTREEVLRIVNHNDIFLLTSLWEGLPISLLEAMYMEKICIVSNVVGNRDVIENNINGFILDKNTYKELISNLQMYNIESVIENAKKDVIKKYNLEIMKEEYRKLYQN